MTWLGRLVERIIGEAHKAKISVETRRGVQPILSLESQLPSSKINEIINFATEQVYTAKIPNLEGMTTLEIGDGPPLFTQRFLQQQARVAIDANIGKSSPPVQGDLSRGFIVNTSAGSTPFGEGFFDYIAARLSTSLQGDISKVIKEISRIIAGGGQGVMIDFHPFGLYAKRGSNRLHSAESTISGIGDYYKIFRSYNMRIIDLKEAFVDESYRSLFKNTDIQSYRNIKSTPLLVFIYFFKPKVKK